ncbi:hypothetical_protein [Candidozyma auris]|uniref:hypothetical_protein n=1 Tax=Candidozyma auris TaxID=498019 RepID=UPI000D2936BF|nr:hypothetical_protein [[Candida] auris]QEO20758.1 hypothetical_protein [[Candida] auris]GBL48727.1 hypothetical protein CAJCM15448_10010 [[Candida] auris]
MIRRRRCQYLTLAVIVLHVIVFSLISARSREKLLPLRDLATSLSEYAAALKERRTFPFDAWTDKIFANYLNETAKDDRKARLAALATNSSALGADRMAVKVPEFFKNDSDNPILVPFEPRLTLGMILNDYNEHLIKSEQHDVDAFEYTLPVFHWSDWTDLSVLNPYFMSFGKDRETCKLFGKTPRKTKSNPNPVKKSPHWCLEDTDVAFLYHENVNLDDRKRAALKEILQSPLRTGFHVDRFGGKNPHDSRKLEAASYLNDFMDKPLSVVLLLPHPSGRSKSIKLNVNGEVGSRVRLSQSELARSVANRLDRVDLREELKRLAAKFKDDESSRYSSHLELQHEDFLETSNERLIELSKKSNVNAHERNYMESLLTTLSGVPPTKYFFEASLHKSTPNWSWSGHYDWRFYKDIINFSDLQPPSLHGLTSAWLRLVNAQKLRSWVAHGTLLSWFWNGINFPWDADVDVQMPISDLHELARQFNQSIIVDFGTDLNGEVKTGRYFLDVGTWISHREFGNGRNNIDARFIDVDTGLYIDITALAISNTVAPSIYDKNLPSSLKRKKGQSMDEHEVERNTVLQVYNCRNRHFSSLKDLSPLKLTYVEGVPAYVPSNFISILEREYEEGGLAEQKYKKYVFLPRLRIWYPFDPVSRFVIDKGKDFKPILQLGSERSKASNNIDKMAVYTMSDEDYLELMARESSLLAEYVVTRDVTLLHQKEIKQLVKGKSTESLLLDEGNLIHTITPFRRDFMKYKHVKDEFFFDLQVEKVMDEMTKFRQGISRTTKLESKTEKEEKPSEHVNISKTSGSPAVLFQPVGAAPERPRPAEE